VVGKESDAIRGSAAVPNSRPREWDGASPQLLAAPDAGMGPGALPSVTIRARLVCIRALTPHLLALLAAAARASGAGGGRGGGPPRTYLHAF
jgi:hypothetical protein